MKQEEVSAIVRTTVEEVFKELKDDSHIKCNFCKNAESSELHEQQHAFISELIDFFRKMNTVRWTVIKAVAVASAFAALALVGFKLKP